MSNQVPIKTINYRTNYNNKMYCDYFWHLDLAPENPIPESTLENNPLVIATMDGSHPPIKAKVFDLLRFPLTDIRESYTLMSHGMTVDQYLDILLQNKKITPETQMALYYYKKIKD